MDAGERSWQIACQWIANAARVHWGGMADADAAAAVAAVPAALNARTRVEAMTHDSDSSWVADMLIEQRDVILSGWLEAAAAQPFHAGRREKAVADHIPELVDALIAVLRRTASPAVDARSTLHEPEVLAAAQSHARMRMEHGLVASDVVAEFRLLRQEIGRAMRFHVADAAPTSDVLGAEMLLHDALDDAAFLAVLAVDEHEAELRRLREALATEQRRVAILLEQLPAAVVIATAASGQVALGHPAVQQITRGPGGPVPAGETPNQWQGFYRDGRRYAPEEWPLARAVNGGEVITGEEIDYMRDDGTRGTVSVNAAPVRDPSGAVVAGVAIFTDVTERKTLEQEKEAFLTAITHDLRSPLTLIKVTATLLRRESSRSAEPDVRVLDRLQRIDEAVGQMDRQLTELQDIARLRTGQALELKRRPVDLVALVQDAAARHQATSEQHELSVDATGLAELELIGRWDKERLDRVLDNLLGNAVKFSPAGGRITLTLTREPEQLGQADVAARREQPEQVGQTDGAAQLVAPEAVLRVTDEGIGIPADDLPHVFDWFRRASNAAGKIAGTGIGMAAARQIVELHGGSIEAESEEGAGSTFTLRLPLEASTSGQALSAKR